tara:strand:+ start:570 stop:950 length:381 start_codon:yes stop_codon:yes gene_type:complete
MSLDRIKDGTARWYVIDTQNLEEYGDNFHKFKGGSQYTVGFHVDKLVFEKDAFGEGEHSYYNSPSLTEASVAALVMKHVNRYNGLNGSFDYITNIEVIDSPFNTPDHPTWRGTGEDLINELEMETV